MGKTSALNPWGIIFQCYPSYMHHLYRLAPLPFRSFVWAGLHIFDSHLSASGEKDTQAVSMMLAVSSVGRDDHTIYQLIYVRTINSDHCGCSDSFTDNRGKEHAGGHHVWYIRIHLSHALGVITEVAPHDSLQYEGQGLPRTLHRLLNGLKVDGHVEVQPHHHGIKGLEV